MPEAIIYASDRKDADALSEVLGDVIAVQTDEDWPVRPVTDLDAFCAACGKVDDLAIAVFDVSEKEASRRLETVRTQMPDAFLILTADRGVPPTRYIRPAIMPSALLLKPLDHSAVGQCFQELVKLYYEKIEDAKDADAGKFCIDTKGQKTFVPMDKIIYFEAREKKISLNTKNRELQFYSSLDTIEQNLPACMVRCHRSFIVNTNYVVEVISNENLLYCSDDIVVPYSRGYKSRVIEALGGVRK